MKKMNVGILIFQDAEVLDFSGPFEVFSVASELNDNQLFNVFTVAISKTPVIAVNGLSVNPHFDFSDCPVIDILIISGGSGTRKIMNDTITMDWVSKAIENAKLTLSICSGARILGRLGILNNKEFTTHHGVFDHLKEIAPLAIPRPDKRYVDNGTFITSGGISAGIDASFYVVKKLFGEAIMKQTSSYMEYNSSYLIEQ